MNIEEIISNKFIKLVIAAFFFLFVYNIIYAIGIFFGWNENILDIYMMWFAILIIFIVILPIKRSNI